MYKSPPWRGLCMHTSILRVYTSIPTCAYTYISQRQTKEVKRTRGRFYGRFCGGQGAGAQRNLMALFGPLRCIKELNHPAPPLPPHPYRPLDRTRKKSTAPYKVHNISLRFIKITALRQADIPIMMIPFTILSFHQIQIWKPYTQIPIPMPRIKSLV